MAIDYNPIFLLGNEVLKGKLSFEQALQKTASTRIEKTLSEEHLEELLLFVDAEKEHNPKAALIFSRLSLLSVEQKQIPETLLANFYHLHGRILSRQLKTDDALNHLRKAKEIFERTGDQVGIADCDLEIAYTFFIMEKLEEALELYDSARKLFQKKGIVDKVARCDKGIGNIYRGQGKLDEALKLYRGARDVFLKEGKKADVAKCDVNIGLVYEARKTFDLRLFESAKEVFKELKMEADVADCDMSIGDMYTMINEFNQALPHFMSARQGFDEAGIAIRTAECDMAIADIYNRILHDYDQGIKYLQSAKMIFEETNNALHASVCALNLANVFSTQEKHDDALELLEPAMKIFDEKRMYQEVARAYSILGRIYRGRAQYDQALDFYGLARRISAEHNMTALVEASDFGMAICWQSMADNFAAGGRFDDALSYYVKAEDVLRRAGANDLAVECTLRMGIVYQILGKFEHAIEVIRKARQTFEEKEMKAEIARCEMLLGATLSGMADFKQAVEFYEKAEEGFTKLDLDVEAAECKIGIGEVLHRTGHYPQAYAFFSTAENIFNKKKLMHQIGVCEMNQGNVCRDLSFITRIDGLVSEGMSHYNTAGLLFEASGLTDLIGKCAYERLILLLNTRDGLKEHFDKFVEAYNQTKKIFKQHNRLIDLAQLDMYMAIVYKDVGNTERSLQLFDSSRSAFKEKGMEIKVSECEMIMSDIFFHSAMYEQALNLLESSRNILEKQDNKIYKILVAKIDAGSGNIWAALDRPDRAIEIYEKVESKLKELDLPANTLDRGMLQFSMANSYAKLHQTEKAIRFYNSAKVIFEDKREHLVAACYLNLGTLYSSMEDYTKSNEHFKTARAMYKQLGIEKEVLRCDLNQGSLYLRQRKIDEAKDILSRVHKKSDSFWELRVKSNFGLGSLFKLTGELEQARRYFNSSIEMIEGMRKSFSREELRREFMNSMYEAYHEMIDICIAQKDFRSALEYVEAIKSRTLAEKIANREVFPKTLTEEEKKEFQRLRLEMRAYAHQLDNEGEQSKVRELKRGAEIVRKEYDKLIEKIRIHEPDYDPDQITNMTYAEIKALVDDDESALVEIFPMIDKTILFVVKRGTEVDKSTLIIKDYDLKRMMNSLNKVMKQYEHFTSSKTVESISSWQGGLENILRELYRKIFLNMQPYLENIKKIIFIPYGMLHLVPLHAMFEGDGKDRKYLIDHYLVTYAPSARILSQCQRRRRVNMANVLIAYANPESTDALYDSEEESKTIARLFGTSQYYPKATKKEIVDHLSKANIFHYTGHAYRAGIILHDGEDREKYDLWTEQEIFSSLELPVAYLVTLSGCETGMTYDIALTDEYVGLTSAFLYAGAPSVISSLWSVPDAPTSLIMRKLYALIGEGKGRAEALRDAQLWLKDPNKRKEHDELINRYEKSSAVVNKSHLPSDLSLPYYWSGFICSGVD